MLTMKHNVIIHKVVRQGILLKIPRLSMDFVVCRPSPYNFAVYVLELCHYFCGSCYKFQKALMPFFSVCSSFAKWSRGDPLSVPFITGIIIRNNVTF